MIDPLSQKYLIDVRTPAEFTAGGALPGAKNVEYQNIAQFLVDQQGADKDADITLYCRSGRRSAIAKTELDALGFNNVKDWGSLETAKAKFDESEREGNVFSGEKQDTKLMTTTADKEKLKQSTNALLKGLKDLE